MLWMETGSPNYEQAAGFANGVHEKYPHMMLAYNLSPSFNWDAAGMTDDEIKSYTTRLGQLGFVWQFITLAGFHLDGLACETFAKAFAKDKMFAYVTRVQREERKYNVTTLKHQQWSGVDLVDHMIELVTAGNSSTKATSEGITEKQF